MLDYTAEDVAGHREGDIVTIQGRKYFLEKKTSRTIKARRYYWFDALMTKVVQFLGGA